MELSRISMLPSTSIAVSYFENFVLPVCHSIAKRDTIRSHSKDISYHEANLKIRIPLNLYRDLKTFAESYYKDKHLQQATINGVHRTHSIYLANHNGKIIINDIPVILSSSNKAIEMFIGKDFIGKSIDEELYKKREIWNFKATLQRLIEEEYTAKRYAMICNTDEAAEWGYL